MPPVRFGRPRLPPDPAVRTARNRHARGRGRDDHGTVRRTVRAGDRRTGRLDRRPDALVGRECLPGSGSRKTRPGDAGVPPFGAGAGTPETLRSPAPHPGRLLPGRAVRPLGVDAHGHVPGRSGRLPFRLDPRLAAVWSRSRTRPSPASETTCGRITRCCRNRSVRNTAPWCGSRATISPTTKAAWHGPSPGACGGSSGCRTGRPAGPSCRAWSRAA